MDEFEYFPRLDASRSRTCKVGTRETASHYHSGERTPGGKAHSFASTRLMLRLLPGGRSEPCRPAQGGTLSTSKIRILNPRSSARTILQVLIAHMAEWEPKFLDRLQQIFTNHHTLGADEQNYTRTAPDTQGSLSSKWRA